MTPEELEMWTEWAGKFEYEALMPRQTAERMADEALIAFRQSRMTGREQARELSRSLKANGFTLLELLLVMLALFFLGTVAIIAYARALGCTP